MQLVVGDFDLFDRREVWICCAGCEDALQKEPEQYFAKLLRVIEEKAVVPVAFSSRS